MYEILPYSYQKAEELGVEIKPSTNRRKKIDVFKNGVFVCSIGAINYLDYPHFIKNFGLKYAQDKKRLYKARHKYDTGDAGFYANKILW